MISKRLSIYGFISAAALVSGVVAGCGGSSSTTGSQPQVSVTGGLPPQPGVGAAGFSSGAAPAPGQQVQVTVGGVTTTVTGTLPANETIPASGIVAVIPNNPTVSPAAQPFFTNVTYAAARKSTTKAPQGTPPQGEVYVDGFDTGVAVNSLGALESYIFVVPGVHTMDVYGPWKFGGGNNQLNVGVFHFGFTVVSDGNYSFPSVVAGKLPGNGGSTFGGNGVKAIYEPLADFANGHAQLILVWAGITKSQTRTIVNGQVTFSDPLADTTDVIPAGGVDSVTFNWTPSQ